MFHYGCVIEWNAMNRSRFVWLILALAVGSTTASFYMSPAPQTMHAEQDEFGGVSLRIEYATTTETREFGLGARESIAPDEAMLFVFPEDDFYGFWMNDMLVSIDIFWLDSKGQVVSIQEEVSPDTYPDVFYPTAPARYVLETAAGFARAHGVVIGTPLLLKSFPTVSK